MKALVLSHENGGSYLLESTGSYLFSKSFTHMPIGSEVEIKSNYGKERLTRLIVPVACVALVAVVISIIKKHR